MADRIYELRTYHPSPGKQEAIKARFRDHTVGLFAKHGIEVIGFWEPVNDDDTKVGTLVYIISYESREAAKASWEGFYADPEWIQAVKESEANGPLLIPKTAVNVLMMPTDFSPLR